MSDVPPEPRPVLPPDADPASTRPIPAQEGEAAPAQRFRDRVWGLRPLIAVALASVIIGGLGGAALASVADDDDEGRFGPGHGRFQQDGPGGPGGMMDRRERREQFKEWRKEQRDRDGTPEGY